MSTPDEKIRLDKWLWQARFFKSRSRAGEVAGGGTVRINGARVSKAAHGVRVGDVLTFPVGRTARVVRIEALGTRRGPAPEAQALYTDLDPPGDAPRPVPRVGERPTKRARREIDAWQSRRP